MKRNEGRKTFEHHNGSTYKTNKRSLINEHLHPTRPNIFFRSILELVYVEMVKTQK